MPSQLLRSLPHLIAGFCFLVLTMVMTWPIVTRLNTHVTPGQQRVMTVPYLNLWTLAWNHHWLKGNTDTYWDANQFYPHRKTLAYSEPQFGMGLLTFPLSFFGANTVLMYNLLLLGFIWGSGMAVYALCWYLFAKHITPEASSVSSRVKSMNGSEDLPLKTTEKYRWTASVTAGVFYSFHFYMFYEMGALQLMATLFPPLTFLALHRFVDANRWIDAFFAGVGFLGCWYTCTYYGLFLSIFVLCFIVKFGYQNIFSRKIMTRGTVTAVITLLGLLPLIVGMQSAKITMEFSRPKSDVWSLSAMVSDYLKFPQNNWLYGKILKIGHPDQGLFFGGVLLCLAGIGIIAFFKARALGYTDPAKLTMDKITQRPQPHQILQFPRRYGSFYIAMAGLAFWLSFGTLLIPLDTTGLGIYRFIAWFSPYNLLSELVPGFSLIRSPYRFSIFCVLFLAVLAGWGSFWISQYFLGRARPVIVSVLLIAALLELLPLPSRLVKVPTSIQELPPIYQHVKKLPPESTLIELPLTRGSSEQQLETEARALYYSTFHWHRIVNGYSGFFPRASVELMNVISELDPETIYSAFETFGVRYILTHEDKLNTTEKSKLSALKNKGLILIAQEENNRLYKLATTPTGLEDSPFNTHPQALKNVSDVSPNVESLMLYESGVSPKHVTLRLNYKVNDNQCHLITPWKHNVECDVAWYPKPEGSEPILISKSVHRNSRLITQFSNALEFNLLAPPPGEYRVKVMQRSLNDQTTFKAPKEEKQPIEIEILTTTSICRISENRFVTFYSVD